MHRVFASPYGASGGDETYDGAAPLPEDVAKFLDTSIQGVAQLEILLHLRRFRDRFSSPASVAADLYLPPAAAREDLERLAAGNLLGVRIETDVLYRYDPGTEDLALTIERLAEIYPERRATILERVVRRRSSAARAFADAFRIKGRGEDG